MKAPRIAYIVGFSAFFADMGYQGAMAILPIFLIFVLKLNFYVFGIVEAFIFGLGALFSFIGGRFSEKYGSKRIAVIGNSFIPLLSFTGFFSIPLISIGFFSSGWWMRNLRSPARRSLLAENVEENQRTASFGILHGLDVGGGLISIIILVTLILLHFSYKYLFFFSIFPLIISTIIIASVKDERKRSKPVKKEKNYVNSKYLFEGIIIGTSLFGFGSYSMGFPIITIAQSSSIPGAIAIVSGVASYGIFLGFSSLTGFILSKYTIKREALSLGVFGYIMSGIGTLGFTFSIIYSLGITGFYLSITVVAIAFGMVETFEPSIISRIVHPSRIGSGMGILSSSRSIGFFIANIIMGVLYEIKPSYSYMYAGIVSIIAGFIILYSLRRENKISMLEII